MSLFRYIFSRLTIAVIAILIWWGTVFYFIIIMESDSETDDHLEELTEQIVREFERNPHMELEHDNFLNNYVIKPISAAQAAEYRFEIKDSVSFSILEQEEEPIRMLKTTFADQRNQHYEIIVFVSTLEKEDLIETIITSLVVLFLLLTIFILMTTKYILDKGFVPFYNLLEWLKGFRLGKSKNLPDKGQIKEFSQLYEAIEMMANRNERMYSQQKEFIGNAAHELQTPLAICRNKLELLVENESFSDKQLEQLGEINEQLNRSIRLNKALLLLSKIENRQFKDQEEINFNELIRKETDIFKDIYEEKGIKIHIKENGILKAYMSITLATILVDNLLKNAFVHTEAGGEIKIMLGRRKIVFFNNGNTALDKNKIFNRFHHHAKQGSDSSGLGLAIIRSISTLYHIKVDYRYNKGHFFEVTF